MPQPCAVRVKCTRGFVAAAGQRLDAAVIDQSQIDDIDRNFRIETGAQLLPHALLRPNPKLPAISTLGDCAV